MFSFVPNLEHLDSDFTANDEWHGVPPQQAGIYEFCCGETAYEAELVTVELHNEELWCRMDGEFRPVRMWHDNLTCPAWRSPRQD